MRFAMRCQAKDEQMDRIMTYLRMGRREHIRCNGGGAVELTRAL